MASGNTLCSADPKAREFPTSGQGADDTRNNHPVIDLAVGDEVHFRLYMPKHYAGATGIDVTALVAATSVTTGNFKLEMSIERITGQDIDADSFAAANATGDIAVSGTSGIGVDALVQFTDGADMDSVVAGDWYRLKIERVAAGASEASGDIEILGVEVEET